MPVRLKKKRYRAIQTIQIEQETFKEELPISFQQTGPKDEPRCTVTTPTVSNSIIVGGHAKLLNIGSQMSQLGELRNRRKELEAHERKLREQLQTEAPEAYCLTEFDNPLKTISPEQDAIRRALSRRGFGRLAALACAGATLPHYNELAVGESGTRESQQTERVKVAIKVATSDELDVHQLVQILRKAAECEWPEDILGYVGDTTSVRTVSELKRVQAELKKTNELILCELQTVSIVLQIIRSQLYAVALIQQQEAFFILHSFHPPDTNHFASHAVACGGIGFAALA
jgi:hypothetical protein